MEGSASMNEGAREKKRIPRQASRDEKTREAASPLLHAKMHFSEGQTRRSRTWASNMGPNE